MINPKTLILLGMMELISAQSFPKCPNPTDSTAEWLHGVHDSVYSPGDSGAACVMSAPERLYQDQSIKNGDCTLVLQSDGNLILWRSGQGKPAWYTGTNNYLVKQSNQGFFVTVQNDGNFVMYLYQEGVSENENIPVFATNTDQPNVQDAELWMSDGSGGFCALYLARDGNIAWQTKLTEFEFLTENIHRPYIYESHLFVNPSWGGGNDSLTLQHDCNVVSYSKRYGDLADVDLSDFVWAAGYTYQGNDKKCVFTMEKDGTYSIYLISEGGNQWERVKNWANYNAVPDT